MNSNANIFCFKVNGLKTRLKYSETDRDNTVKKIAGLQKQLDKMREDLEKFDPTIRSEIRNDLISYAFFKLI